MFLRLSIPITMPRDWQRKRSHTFAVWEGESFPRLRELYHAEAGPVYMMIHPIFTPFSTVSRHMKYFSAQRASVVTDSNSRPSSVNGWRGIFSGARRPPIWNTLPLTDLHKGRKFDLVILRVCWGKAT